MFRKKNIFLVGISFVYVHKSCVKVNPRIVNKYLNREIWKLLLVSTLIKIKYQKIKKTELQSIRLLFDRSIKKKSSSQYLRTLNNFINAIYSKYVAFVKYYKFHFPLREYCIFNIAQMLSKNSNYPFMAKIALLERDIPNFATGVHSNGIQMLFTLLG